jgi:hypothetical protein
MCRSPLIEALARMLSRNWEAIHKLPGQMILGWGQMKMRKVLLLVALSFLVIACAAHREPRSGAGLTVDWGKPDPSQYHDISKDDEIPESEETPEDNDRSEYDNTRMSLAEECELWHTRGAYLPVTQPEYEQAKAKCSKLSADQLRTQSTTGD